MLTSGSMMGSDGEVYGESYGGLKLFGGCVRERGGERREGLWVCLDIVGC